MYVWKVNNLSVVHLELVKMFLDLSPPMSALVSTLSATMLYGMTLNFLATSTLINVLLLLRCKVCEPSF
jgi:hypothetical protein